MPAPPKITVGADAGASAIAGSVLHDWQSPEPKILGASLFQTIISGMGAANPTYPQSNAGTMPWWVSFVFEGSKFEFLHRGSQTAFRLWVDGLPSTSTVQTLTGASNFAKRYVLCDFGTRARRRIMIEFTQVPASTEGVYYGGLTYTATDNVSSPTMHSQARMIVLGDSYSLDPVLSARSFGYPHRMGWLLGIDDTWSIGESNTGFLNDFTGLPNYAHYGARVATDLYPYSPDIVFVQGSTNDDGLSVVSLQAEVTRLLNEIKATLPNAVVICSGLLFLGTWSAARIANNNAVKAGALAASVPFIDATGWSSGTGRVGATTGDGMADYYVSTDGNHPADAGHIFLGDRLAGAMATILGIAVG